jgi:hypothetical protein
MVKKYVSTLLLVPLFSFFLFLGNSFAYDGKSKTPKPDKPAPKVAYVISQAEKQQPTAPQSKTDKKKVKETKKDKKCTTKKTKKSK